MLILLILLGPGSLTFLFGRSLPIASAAAAPGIPVGTFLYLWYGFNATSLKWTGGLGTSHWNDSAGGIIKDRPDIGYYPSLDNNTLAFQLSNMKSSGISVIAVSWWGPGNSTQSGSSSTLDSAINNATVNLFRYLESTKNLWQFKVAVMVEPFNSSYNMTPHDYARLYGFLYTHFYHPYNDLIQYWQGKPLVMSFNGPWSSFGRLPMNYTFAYRLVGSAPNPVDWYFWEGMNFLDSSGGTAQPQNYEYSPGISPDGEVGILPRYDDYYLFVGLERPGYMRFDYKMTEGLYYSEWNYVIDRAKTVDMVLLYSWNEYHERTALEPHADFTTGHFSGVGDTEYYVGALQKAALSAPAEGVPSNPVNLSYAFIAVAVGLGSILALGAILLSRRKA